MQVLWWKTGLIPPLGVYKDYWLDPFSLFWIEVIAVQFAELKRCSLSRFGCHALGAASVVAITHDQLPMHGSNVKLQNPKT